jgi:hypothetical protein
MDLWRYSTSYTPSGITFSSNLLRLLSWPKPVPSTSAFSSCCSGCPSLFYSAGGLVNPCICYSVRRHPEHPQARSYVDILSLDFFEVAVLLGACFIVNYVTADAKTNWLEGFTMVSFYIMIVSGCSLANGDCVVYFCCGRRLYALGFIQASLTSN